MVKELSKPWYEMDLGQLWKLFPIEIRDYNPDYPEWYRKESDALAALLGADAGRIRGESPLSGAGHIDGVDIGSLLEKLKENG